LLTDVSIINVTTRIETITKNILSLYEKTDNVQGICGNLISYIALIIGQIFKKKFCAIILSMCFRKKYRQFDEHNRLLSYHLQKESVVAFILPPDISIHVLEESDMVFFRLEQWVIVMFGISLLLVVVLPILTARADSANPVLYPVESKPNGLTFAQWSQKWWQWFVSIPQPQNPGNDQTGKYCNVGQDNPNVWFLTGAGSGTFVRTCSIPAGKSILIQVVGNECSYAENPSLKTESELRTCAVTGDKPTSVHVTIDGKSVQNLQNYIVQTPLFDLTLPDNNIFGAPAGPTKAVSHAFVVFLQPLSPGKHDIHFDQVTLANPETGSNNFAYDITYHLMMK
jgi:hypothetical protein